MPHCVHGFFGNVKPLQFPFSFFFGVPAFCCCCCSPSSSAVLPSEEHGRLADVFGAARLHTQCLLMHPMQAWHFFLWHVQACAPSAFPKKNCFFFRDVFRHPMYVYFVSVIQCALFCFHCWLCALLRTHAHTHTHIHTHTCACAHITHARTHAHTLAATFDIALYGVPCACML